MDFHDWKQDSIKTVFTFGLAFMTGLIFQYIDTPVPFLMGSLFGVWFLGSFIKPVRRYLGVARWVHIPIVLGLAVLIGASFQPDIVHLIATWWISVVVMLFATVLATSLGFFWLVKVRGYPPLTALLGCIPGGQAEILVLARDLVEKDYVVALMHLVRVATIFFSTPWLLSFVKGSDATLQSNAALQQMPHLYDLSLMDVVLFFAIAFVGYQGARLLRLPMPHLLGPLLLSITAHLAGWVVLPRISEFVILAQLAIGGAVGARLARVPFLEVIIYLRDAVINTVIVLTVYALMSLSLVWYLGVDFLQIWLSFIPGGLYEVTLLALLFGFDVAFIAFHHTVRLIMIFLCLPLITRSFPAEKLFRKI